MTELIIPFVEHRLKSDASAVYECNTGEAAHMALVTLRALLSHPDLFAQALSHHDCDELIDVAEAVVHVRKISREMDNDEALPLLTQMRLSDKPEWMRALAGRELVRRSLEASK